MTENTSQFEEFESTEDFSNLDTQNLITEFWIKPRLVYAYLFKTDPKKYLWSLMIIAGAVSGFETGLNRSFAFDAYATGFVIGATIAGALLGWISIFIYAWLLALAGSGFLNGTAKASDFRTVVAWSNIPTISGVFLTLISFLLYGNGAYFNEYSQVELIVIVVLAVLQLGLYLWSIVLSVIGTMYIQNFGAGKAIINVLIPIISFLIIIFIFYFSLGII